MPINIPDKNPDKKSGNNDKRPMVKPIAHDSNPNLVSILITNNHLRQFYYCRLYHNNNRNQLKKSATLAIYHLSIKISSRGKGKSAVAAAAYRAGEKIKNEYDGNPHAHVLLTMRPLKEDGSWGKTKKGIYPEQRRREGI